LLPEFNHELIKLLLHSLVVCPPKRTLRPDHQVHIE